MKDQNGVENESCLTHLNGDIECTSVDGVFIKGFTLKDTGMMISQHSHEYAHTSLLVRGRVRLWKDGNHIGDFSAPSTIFIEAKAKHKFQSLEDNTVVYCIHNVSATGIVLVHEKHILEDA